MLDPATLQAKLGNRPAYFTLMGLEVPYDLDRESEIDIRRLLRWFDHGLMTPRDAARGIMRCVEAYWRRVGCAMEET